MKNSAIFGVIGFLFLVAGGSAVAQIVPAIPNGTGSVGVLRGSIVKDYPELGLIFDEAMTRFNGVQALNYGGSQTLEVEEIVSVAALHAGQFVQNPNGIHVKVNMALGVRVSGDRTAYTVLDSDALYAYQNAGGPPPSPVTYAIGPDLAQHPPGFPIVFTPRYAASGANLGAVYEIHNVSQLTDDPICQTTPTGPIVLVAIGGTVPNDPPRPEPTPFQQGNTFTDVSKPVIGANYSAWIGNGSGFNGTYTRRRSDGAKFRVVDAAGLDFGGAASQTTAFRGDDLIISTGGTSASGGIYKADPEGQTPAVLVLPHRFAYDPNDPSRQFRDGTVRDIDGDRAVIVGRAEGSVPAMFLWNLVDGEVQEILRGGSPIPGGGTFTSFPTAAISARGSNLSQSLVAFTGTDQNFAPAGLFFYADGKIASVARPGEIVDGNEIQTVDFQVDALDGNVLAHAVRFNNGGSVAYINVVAELSIDKIRSFGSQKVIEGRGVPSSIHTVLSTDDLSQPFTPRDTTVADSNGVIVYTDEQAAELKRIFKMQARYWP